ncbi:hypothetical protein DPEC_G00084860 [Dallia pectoralis]|uniref:Uncharacterized protein n=1 Tax=Dallia pectoralis TaxID=75939 RepID=A0ACC2GZD0_DALPE|nr:hypothetical protein DPEC_G00084860 [Dallia pectoralis]
MNVCISAGPQATRAASSTAAGPATPSCTVEEQNRLPYGTRFAVISFCHCTEAGPNQLGFLEFPALLTTHRDPIRKQTFMLRLRQVTDGSPGCVLFQHIP